MSAAVHAEDHQGGDDAPAEVTRVQMGALAREKYEAYLESQLRMHRAQAKALQKLLDQSKSMHDE